MTMSLPSLSNKTGHKVLIILLRLSVAITITQASAQTHDETQTIQDNLQSGGQGPPLVQVPAGRFVMGSPEDEAGRYPDEGPQHTVVFAQAFLLGKTEVTVAQFRTFVQATGYKTDAEKNTGSFLRDPTTGNWSLKGGINWRFDHVGKPNQDNNPVVHVSWQDATAYVQWLSKETRQHYRLPSEAELEYANRAGSQQPYWWGNHAPPAKSVNVKGDRDYRVADSRLWEHTTTEQQYAFREGETPIYFQDYGDGYHGLAPAGNFAPNAFGLFDTTGNVWEWVQDCWHKNYEGAPTDGSAWTTGSCEQRIVRGGSFYCYPRHVRSANRWPRWPEFRNMYIGFRVARDLSL
jgi:formylglycine-generating enzyme required for sulfatase activity